MTKEVNMKYLAIFSLLFLTACGQAVKTKTETIYVKCPIPEIPPAQLETIPKDAPAYEKLRLYINNCEKIKAERDLLREVIELCK